MDENRLKIIRDNLGGVSQAKFAAMTGIPLYKIKYAETSNAKISREIAKAIEEKLDYNQLWVLTGEGEKFVQQDHGSASKGELGSKTNHYETSTELPPMISGWDKELISACLTLKKIFDDKVHKKAISENLHAFDLSIDDRKAKEEINKKLQESLKENEGVQNRISKLEELCEEIPNLRIQFETLQTENRKLRTENKKLRDLNGGYAPTDLSPDNAAPTGTSDKET